MDLLHVHQLQTRYRLPRSMAQHHARLDKILLLMLDEALEPALARAGIDTTMLICIRDVYVPVRLRMSNTDMSLAVAWALRLAEAVKEVTQGKGRPGVAVYQSERQALLDMILGVATDDLTRAWAWHQVGIWQQPAAVGAAALEELTRTLEARPTTIVSTLSTLPVSILGRLLARLEEAQWIRLAVAALQSVGVDGLPSAAHSVSRILPHQSLLVWAERLVAHSHLAAALCTHASVASMPQGWRPHSEL